MGVPVGGDAEEVASSVARGEGRTVELRGVEGLVEVAHEVDEEAQGERVGELVSDDG